MTPERGTVMSVIEPNWPALLLFVVLWATTCAGGVWLAGYWPRSVHPNGHRDLATMLPAAVLAAALVLLAVWTTLYGISTLRWTTLAITGGFVILFAPGAVQACPERLRDGRLGLALLAALLALGLGLAARARGDL